MIGWYLKRKIELRRYMRVRPHPSLNTLSIHSIQELLDFTFNFSFSFSLVRDVMISFPTQRQYRDLRRRVARPFSRVKIILHRRAGHKKAQQNTSSYVSYQPCKSGKAAILTSFIHLPGNSADGRPAHGRTGLCLGTALVRLNDKSGKDRGGRGRKRRGGREGEGEEMVGLQQSNGSVGERRPELTSDPSRN